MDSTRFGRRMAIATLLLVAACGGGDGGGDDGLAAPAGTVVDAVGDTSPGADGSLGAGESPPDPTDATAATTAPADAGTGPAPVADACALLDETFLNETFAGQTGMFGEPFEFREGGSSTDGLVCEWDDGSTGLSLRLIAEDAGTAETDDHSSRPYNIDVEPVVEPQDGPGEKAVLLVDKAFDDLGSDGFPYGYFFVQDGVAVYVKTVGLDVGAEGLRRLADEASTRLAER